jgi:hypothetical protein
MQVVPGDGAAGQGSQQGFVSRRARNVRAFVFISSIIALALTGASHLSGRTIEQAAATPAAAAPVIVDTDGDGMPDDWETFFGLNPNDPSDATGDPDHDGLTNLQEYQQGGHPFGADKHYFAEGAVGFFRTDIGIVNPSATNTAKVQLTYFTESGAHLSQLVSLAPMQRKTVSVNDFLAGTGVSGGIATIVESDNAIFTDRFMEWGATGYGSSLSSSVAASSTTWYFAEGATSIFQLYYLLLNPGNAPAHVTVKYLQEFGGPVTRTYTVPAHARTTISVNADPALIFTSTGAAMSSDVPIVAERAMYLSSLFEIFSAGAAGAGAPQAAMQWSFAEGSPGGFFDEFLLIANPGNTSTTATVIYRRPDGVSATATYSVPAQGRRTVFVNQEIATNPALAPIANSAISTVISAPVPIVAERTMWWPRNALSWYENATSLGATQPGLGWTVSEGRVGGPRHEQTYVLVANTAATAGSVQITVLADNGTSATHTLPIPAFGRITVDVGTSFSLTDTHFSAFIDSVGPSPVPLVVEYSRYGSGDGRVWSAGGTTLGTPRTPAPPVDTAPTVTGTTPANNATNVPFDSDLSVTFSEPVSVTAAAFTLECPVGTPKTLTNLTGTTGTTFNLHPTTPMPFNTVCKLVVHAAAVTDGDTIDPPDTMASDVTVTFTTGACPAITVSPSTLPGATPGAAYGPVQFTQTGGSGAITWTLQSGSLPAGMNLSASGALGGTPTATGTFTFTVRATDVNGCFGEVTVTLTVTCPTITVTPTALLDAVVNTAYSPVTFTQTGSPTTVTWTLQSGALPAGMTLSAAGVLSGTPTATGAFTFTVRATDTSGCFGEVTVTLHVNCPTITVFPASLSNGTVGDPYGPATFTVTGSTSPLASTFAVTTGTLPAGLTLTSGGVLSGTATSTGTSTFTVTATDQYGCSGARVGLSLTFNCPTITVTPTTLTAAIVGTAYTPVSFSQTGGHGTITFTLQSGALPTGMNISAAGVLSGTPTQTGSFVVTVRATDANGCFGEVTVTLDVNCPTITVTNPVVTTGLGGVPFSQTFTQSGATSPVFTVNSGTLPTGLNLSAAGVLSGTPTVSGSFPITVKVSGSFGCSGIGGTYALVIQPNAVDDTYTETVLGNVPVDSSVVGFSVVTNDVFAGTPTITAFDAVTVHGGAVVMTTSGANIGKFTYNPPRGYTGVDSFTYTINDGSSSDTATVTLNVAGMAWFVNAGAGCGGSCDGRLTTPYTSIATFQGVNNGTGTNPKSGDSIFVYQAASAYTGTVTLLSNQKLYGQDHTAASFAALTGLSVPTSALSVVPSGNAADGVFTQLSSSSGTVIGLNSGNSVRGLTVNTTGGGATGIGGNTGGTLAISEVSVAGSGPAVNLTGYNETITFKSLSSTSGGSGISLTNMSGSFTVTGTGTTTGSGGTISGGNPTINLSNVSNLSLANMTVQNSASDGIRAVTLNGLTLTNVHVQNNGVAQFDHGVDITGLTGTVTISNSSFTGSADNNFSATSSAGTVNMTVTNTAFGNNSATVAGENDGLLIKSNTTADFTVSVTGSTFTAHKGDHFQATAADSANLHVTFNNNTLTGGNVNALGQDITINAATGVPGYAGQVTYDISNNNITGAIAPAINVNLGTSSAAATMSGTVTGNTIGGTTAGSGSTAGSGISIDARGNGTHRVRVENNIIRHVADRGIAVFAVDGNGAANLKIFKNVISAIDGAFGEEGIYVQAGAASVNIFGVSDSTFVCAEIGGGANANTLVHGTGVVDDFRLRQRFSTTIRLPGYAGASTDTAAVVTFVGGNNGGAAGSAAVQAPGGGFVAGASCSTP